MIKGLTDQMARLPRIGELRKGAPKETNKPGRDLEHFRFTTQEPGLADTFSDAYGAQPTDIEVFLPFPTTDENLEAWQETWVAGGLVHRCDGETCVVWTNGGGRIHRLANSPEGTVPPKCQGGCKPVGRLAVMLPKLGRIGLVTVLTTSVHDIATLHANLAALEYLHPRGDLRGVPLILKRRAVDISVPKGDKRVRMTKHLLSIEVAPRYALLQFTAMERAALPPAELPALTDGESLEETAVAAGLDENRAPMINDEQAARLQELGAEMIRAGKWANWKAGREVLAGRYGQGKKAGDLTMAEAADFITALELVTRPAEGPYEPQEEDISF